MNTINTANKTNVGYFVCWVAIILECWDDRLLGSWKAAVRLQLSATLEPLYHPQTLEPWSFS